MTKKEEVQQVTLETEGEESKDYVTYPDEEIPLARYNVALDEAKRDPDGTWEVIRTVKQVITFDGKNFYVREKKIKGMDSSFEKASNTTLNAMEALLQEYAGDFFSKGEWPGFQYMMNTEDKNNVIKEEHHGTIESV